MAIACRLVPQTRYNKLVQISYMLFNRLLFFELALVLFVLQELTLTQKGYKSPITVKTINNGELTASSNVSSLQMSSVD
jgi:hypothetical protein